MEKLADLSSVKETSVQGEDSSPVNETSVLCEYLSFVNEMSVQRKDKLADLSSVKETSVQCDDKQADLLVMSDPHVNITSLLLTEVGHVSTPQPVSISDKHVA